MSLVLIPAYGRDYNTAAEVKADWEKNKDFKIASIGPYAGQFINKQDADSMGIPKGSYIRYKRLSELTFVGVWEEPESENETCEETDEGWAFS